MDPSRAVGSDDPTFRASVGDPTFRATVGATDPLVLDVVGKHPKRTAPVDRDESGRVVGGMRCVTAAPVDREESGGVVGGMRCVTGQPRSIARNLGGLLEGCDASPDSPGRSR